MAARRSLRNGAGARAGKRLNEDLFETRSPLPIAVFRRITCEGSRHLGRGRLRSSEGLRAAA
eukprot:5442013-Pyramimonas_sp.AAC.1